jgi:hypothetical protein
MGLTEIRKALDAPADASEDNGCFVGAAANGGTCLIGTPTQ